MKKILLFIISCSIIVSMTGCATMINEEMASWVGYNANDLIASWGPPQQTMSDGQGGVILIYSQVRQWTTPGQAETNIYGTADTYGNIYDNIYSANTYGRVTSYTTYTPPETYGYNAYRMFWVDKNGKIYRWAWKGL